MELIALAGNPSRRRKLQLKPVCLDMPSPYSEVCFGRWGRGNHNLIQRSKQRYSNMLWIMRNITRHKRSYGHPIHPDLTPDVLTCVLPLGTVSSRRESEVESVHLFPHYNPIFQRMSSYFSTQALAYTTQSYHIHLHTTKVLWRWTSGEAVGVGYTVCCSCRPAHMRLSSIWSISVRGSSQRNSAVD